MNAHYLNWNILMETRELVRDSETKVVEKASAVLFG